MSKQEKGNVKYRKLKDNETIALGIGGLISYQIYQNVKETSTIRNIKKIIEAFNIPIIAKDGFEADDVIGTLAVVAARQGVEVIVSSGDKDLSQLVNEHITIIDTMNGKRRDMAGVEAEFGVPARLMVDYQTLVGDQVDNVPGVEKVGPKTAAKWLQEHGSLDALVAQADTIKGVAGENLRKALAWLPMGRKLVTVVTDCDLSRDIAGFPALDALALKPVDRSGLLDFYARFGFQVTRTLDHRRNGTTGARRNTSSSRHRLDVLA